MDVIKWTYTVALRNFPGSSSKDLIRAETLYAIALERQLGGQQGVTDTLSTVQALQDAPTDSAPHKIAAIQSWAKATAAAREAAYQGLTEEPGSFFDVRLS